MLDSPKPPTHDAASAERFAARRREASIPSSSPAIDAFVGGTSSDPIALLKKRASLVRQLSMKLDIDDEAASARRELATQDSNLTAALAQTPHELLRRRRRRAQPPPAPGAADGRPLAAASRAAAAARPVPTPSSPRRQPYLHPAHRPALTRLRAPSTRCGHTPRRAVRGGGVRPPRDALPHRRRPPAGDRGRRFAAVAAAMRAHPNSADVQAEALSALRGLCTGSDDVGCVRKQLAHVLGTFPLAVAAMAAHGAADAAVAVAGCGCCATRAVRWTTPGCRERRRRRRRARSRRRPPLRAHPNDAELARVALGLLRNVCVSSDPLGRARMQTAADAGAVDLAVVALGTHSKDEAVAVEGLGMLRNVCSGRPPRRQAEGGGGGGGRDRGGGGGDGGAARLGRRAGDGDAGGVQSVLWRRPGRPRAEAAGGGGGDGRGSRGCSAAFPHSRALRVGARLIVEDSSAAALRIARQHPERMRAPGGRILRLSEVVAERSPSAAELSDESGGRGPRARRERVEHRERLERDAAAAGGLRARRQRQRFAAVAARRRLRISVCVQ